MENSFFFRKGRCSATLPIEIELGNRTIRAGFEVMHFRLGIEYNLIGNSSESQTFTDGTGNTVTNTVSSKNSYLGIKLGFFIGGSRK